MAYDDTNTGTLFKNKNIKHDRSPGYTGRVNVEGTWYWLSAWVKTAGPNAKNPGEKFFSLSLTEMDDQPVSQTNNNSGGFDDDIPF